MTSSDATNIFITGATGYIGGTVLSRFLAHPKASSFVINALVRSPEKAGKLKAFGVTPVVGSLSDLQIIEKFASEADVVLSVANADHIPSTQAILKGLKSRHTATRKLTTFIHTSGISLLSDNARGEYSEVVYDDMNLEQIEALPPTQLHRDVDLEIINADTEGYVRTYIILPSGVWGLATGPLVDLGIQSPQSMQLPVLIDAAVARGRGGMVGAGKNIWSHVNIEDMADLYVFIYDATVEDPGDTAHGRAGLYFGENGELSSYEHAMAISQALVDTKLVKEGTAEPTTFSKEEMALYFRDVGLMGNNGRCRSTRAKAMGWQPKYGNVDYLRNVQIELEAGRWKGSVGKLTQFIQSMLEGGLAV